MTFDMSNASPFGLKHIVLLAFVLLFVSCKEIPEVREEDPAGGKQEMPVQVPAFQRDSAYAYIEKQVSFGPRVPGTEGHKATREWLVQKLKSFGATVREQSFKASTATIGDVRATNIIASFNPTYARRVLLAAHWDTRFAADEDDEGKEKPHDGADDGGSGVGVLLEIGRLIKENPINMGVDIIFFDVEDQGLSGDNMNTWCLGSQYWGNHLHVPGYRAEYGILLDMVGAKGAVFQKEDVSQVLPPDKAKRVHALYDQIWKLAQSMSKANYFINNRTNPITDDHLFVNTLTSVAMIDIIHKPLNSVKGFGDHWHTHEDNLAVIDPNVLGAVGQVVLAYLYNSATVEM